MAEGGLSPPDLETQQIEITNLIKKQLKKGEVRYLLDTRWFKQWKKYVGFERWDSNSAGEQSAHPGPIDNKPLFKDEENGEIKEHLIEELDYVFLPEEAWNSLVSWYGLTKNQEPIVRDVVENGLYVKLCHVEVYLVEFRLCQDSDTDMDNGIMKKFSKADTIDHIEKEMRKLFEIPDDKETRVWNRYATSTLEQLVRKDCTVQDAGLYQGQVLVIEVKNDDGTWSRQAKNTNSALDYGSSSTLSESKNYGTNGVDRGVGSTITGPNRSTRYNTMDGGYNMNYNSCSYNDSNVGDNQPGLCGLNNLGNTCFMNSALQCMSNTPPITRYFLEDQYWDELNTGNPLGMKGEIAKSYAELIKIVWSGKHGCTAPRNFKMQVGRFAPQFSGYQQQDSQELMAFLLDGLHEDLNRIKKKPYIELRDSDGRSDEVVAQEAWDNYRKRNNSIIVDIFHGLLKSTLVCPECSKISVTFDPFCYLTLPLPVKKERQIDVCFISADPSETPIKYKLTVPKAGCINDLCEALRKFTGIPANRMCVVDVYCHKFQKIFQLEEGVNNIMDRDYISVYEMPVTSLEDPEQVVLPVYLRQKRFWPGCTNESRSSAYLFGHPLLVTVSRSNCTYSVLYEAILSRMQRFVTVPPADHEWWNKNEEGNVLNGEVEMANGDEDAENDSQSEGCKEDDEGIDSQEEYEGGRSFNDNNPKVHRLFTMHFVNSAGSSEVEKIKDDDRPIRFSLRPYLAIDWHHSAKEVFYDEKLAEEVEQHESVSLNSRSLQKRQVIQLNECLELFTATERLSAEDSWYCPACKKHQQATKKFDLWSLPQVLVLCFKRFSYNRYMRDKIDTLVEFPTRGLNMNKFIINRNHGPAMYDLIGVCNHYGGLGGGHYTAYAKNKDDLKWYYFDDSSVSPAKEESVVSKAAYVLFYMLRDPRASAAASAISREIPAAIGTPDTCDNGIGGSSSEEDVRNDTMDLY